MISFNIWIQYVWPTLQTLRVFPFQPCKQFSGRVNTAYMIRETAYWYWIDVFTENNNMVLAIDIQPYAMKYRPAYGENFIPKLYF